MYSSHPWPCMEPPRERILESRRERRCPCCGGPARSSSGNTTSFLCWSRAPCWSDTAYGLLCSSGSKNRHQRARPTSSVIVFILRCRHSFTLDFPLLSSYFSRLHAQRSHHLRNSILARQAVTNTPVGLTTGSHHLTVII